MSTTLETTELASASHKAAYDIGGEPVHSAGRSALLLVSVGADYHEGERFGATVDLLNRENFARITIGVADTLQRHNEPTGGATERYERTRRRGDAWLHRNRPYLDMLRAPTDTLRWDTALSHPRYPTLHSRVRAAYRDDERYRSAVDATLDRFIDRRRSRGEEFDEVAVRAGCLTYILEECPIIQPLWAEQNYDYVVYPQRISTAMNATRDLFVVPEHPDRAQWLPLRFKKRRSAMRSAEKG